MKEELYELANHIASAKGGLPQEWQDWASEIEMDIRKLVNREAQPVGVMNIGSETCSDYLVAWTKAGAQLGKGVHWLYTAPPAPAPAPAVQDEIDSFADQVIGTKDKIIRLPAPMPVPLEGIRVYLNADTIISFLEKQGYIVEVSRE